MFLVWVSRYGGGVEGGGGVVLGFNPEWYMAVVGVVVVVFVFGVVLSLVVVCSGG